MTLDENYSQTFQEIMDLRHEQIMAEDHHRIYPDKKSYTPVNHLYEQRLNELRCELWGLHHFMQGSYDLSEQILSDEEIDPYWHEPFLFNRLD